VNLEPNKLALLISLICAGTSTNAFSKAEGTSERENAAQQANALLRDLSPPASWPLILNGIRDAEAGSLGLGLSASAVPEFQPLWRSEAQAQPQADAYPNAVDEANAQASSRAAKLESVDPLELANAGSPIDTRAAPASTPGSGAMAWVESEPAEPTAAGGQPAAIQTPAEHSQLATTPQVRPDAPQSNILVTPSAQRVMRMLAAVRFPALETIDSVEALTKVGIEPAPSAAPTALTPCAKVLATLDEVLTAPAAPAVTGDVSLSASSAADDISLEAAIAARQEVKRMKQRARAEEVALMRAAQAQAQAQQAQATRPNPFGGERVAVRDNALDRVRGGFVTPGLNISFGIERAVYINGALVTTTSLNISDLGRITSSNGTKLTEPGSLALIQSGAGNSVAGGAFSSSSGAGLNANTIGTVVQNTLDGQKIQNITVINATANSLGVLRDLNLQNTLRSSLIDSLRR
jgi:hypothetical protein